MSSETKLNLAEKFRQNWQSQYPYLGRNDYRPPQPNILRHVNRNVSVNITASTSNTVDLEDDSLTNLNWLQNMNLFSMPQCPPPLSPMPTTYFQSIVPQMDPIINTTNIPSRFTHPFFETNGLYAEVAQNLEFMNEEASTHFFRVNNQLRPPFSDINLISMAIYSYSKHKVSFPEICQWIEETFPYYKIINQDWKVGIRNHLTLSKCFQKVPRRKDEVEKGGFWRFSNDFLSYLEKSRLIVSSLNNIMINVQQENANQIDYRYGKFLPRKRTIESIGTQDENLDSAFKIPIKKHNFGDNEILTTLTDFDQFPNELLNSISFKSDQALQLLCHSLHSNPMVTNCNTLSMDGLSLLTTSSDSSNLSHHYERSKCDNSVFNPNADELQMSTITSVSSIPCPEQITEEEFLSGRLFNHNYVTSQSNLENLPTLLDSQINFNSSEFNINNLSITGVGIRPPEWWNQSLSASQISISKLNCSLRSLTSVTNIDRGSPFGDDDHQIIWHSDQNLEELDILFGLN